MKNKKLINIILTGLFAAMVFAMTNFIKLPTGTGYVHLGDAFIYLGACFLPTPLALLAGAIGGALADFAGGYVQYMIPTFIIKALISLPFSSKGNKLLTKFNSIGTIISGFITVAGYYITSVVMLVLSASGEAGFVSQFFNLSNWIASLSNIPENVGQAIGSALLFVVFSAALDKANTKKALKKII